MAHAAQSSPRRMRRLSRHVAVVPVVLGVLLGGGACGPGEPGAGHGVELTVPKVYYLRPPGDRAGQADKVGFKVEVDGVRQPGGERTPPERPSATLTIDARGADKVVRLKRRKSSYCTGDTASVTCSIGPGPDPGPLHLADEVTPIAAEGSKAGDTGLIHYRLTTADGTVRTAGTRVVVGEPVLELWHRENVTAAPGGRVTFPLTIRNTGEVAVQGVGFGIDAQAMAPRQRYRNCRYMDFHKGRVAVCRFPDLRVGPGETVTFTPALEFDAPAKQVSSMVRESVWPLVTGPWPDDGWPTQGDLGDGDELTPHTASRPPAGQGAFSGAHVAWTNVGLGLGTDFAAIGATVRGKLGTEQRISIGARNNGPGELGPGTVVRMVFTVPLGSMVVKQPMRAIDVDVDEPLCEHAFDAQQRDTYTCDLAAMPEGETRTLDFTLRLNEPGTGQVQLRDSPSDNRPGNGTALVTIAP